MIAVAAGMLLHSRVVVVWLVALACGALVDCVPAIRTPLRALLISRPKDLIVATLAVSADGLSFSDGATSASIPWNEVIAVGQTRTLIVFLTSPRYGRFVPKRAFETAADTAHFFETASAYRRAAIDGALPNLPPDPTTGAAETVWPPRPARIGSDLARAPLVIASIDSFASPADMVGYDVYMRPGDRTRRAIAVFCWFLFALGLALLTTMLLLKASGLLTIPFLLPLAGFYAYYSVPVQTWVYARKVPKGESGWKWRTELTNRELVADVADGRIAFTWPRVERIAETRDLVVFVLGPQLGHFVPKRSFATDEAAAEFLETARALHQGRPLDQ